MMKTIYDFSNVEDGEEILCKLTINTDGFIPKGHTTLEIWPVFIQIADLSDRHKSTHESVAVVAAVVSNGKPPDFAWEAGLLEFVTWLRTENNAVLILNDQKAVTVNFKIQNLSVDLAVPLFFLSYIYNISYLGRLPYFLFCNMVVKQTKLLFMPCSTSKSA